MVMYNFLDLISFIHSVLVLYDFTFKCMLLRINIFLADVTWWKLSKLGVKIVLETVNRPASQVK